MIFRPFGKVVEIVGHIPPSRGIYYTERICFFDEQRAKNEPRTEKVDERATLSNKAELRQTPLWVRRTIFCADLGSVLMANAINRSRVVPNTPLGIPLHHCL